MPKTQQEVLQVARQLYRQRPDWVVFFREVLGLDGIIRRAFPNAEDMAVFETTPEYEQIQEMLAELREERRVEDQEPTTVITVRMPKVLHETLKAEAYERHTSMNKLCIAKLLQVLEEPCEESATGSKEGVGE